jgi:hypothetical protein
LGEKLVSAAQQEESRSSAGSVHESAPYVRTQTVTLSDPKRNEKKFVTIHQ